MFKRLKYLPVLTILSLFTPSGVFAQTRANGTWAGRCVGTGAMSDVPTIQGFECLFYNILQVIVYAAGIAFFVMFIKGGFDYMFSANDQKKVATASSTLTMTIVGLVGVIASWLILLFIKNFTGIDVTNFQVPGP